MIQVTAPAKIIIFGEHAVVYGKPALALPLMSLCAKVTITPDQEIFSIYAADTHQILYFDQDSDHPLITAASYTLQELSKNPPQIQLQVSSDIPIASGLGSGAAVSAAIVRSLYAHFNQLATDETINRIVYQVEKIHHGTPSGIDNTVIVYRQPVFFIKDQPPEHFRVGKTLSLLIADTGIPASTKHAVEDVRKLYDSHKDVTQTVLDEIGEIVLQARDAIESGYIEQIGVLMLRNHTLLQRLTVSSQALDTLVDAAVKAGAYGAKLSGGGRGGNMIALVNEQTLEPVKQALSQAGAVRVLSTTIKASDD